MDGSGTGITTCTILCFNKYRLTQVHLEKAVKTERVSCRWSSVNYIWLSVDHLLTAEKMNIALFIIGRWMVVARLKCSWIVQCHLSSRMESESGWVKVEWSLQPLHKSGMMHKCCTMWYLAGCLYFWSCHVYAIVKSKYRQCWRYIIDLTCNTLTYFSLTKCRWKASKCIAVAVSILLNLQVPDELRTAPDKTEKPLGRFQSLALTKVSFMCLNLCWQASFTKNTKKGTLFVVTLALRRL